MTKKFVMFRICNNDVDDVDEEDSQRNGWKL